MHDDQPCGYGMIDDDERRDQWHGHHREALWRQQLQYMETTCIAQIWVCKIKSVMTLEHAGFGMSRTGSNNVFHNSGAKKLFQLQEVLQMWSEQHSAGDDNTIIQHNNYKSYVVDMKCFYLEWFQVVLLASQFS